MKNVAIPAEERQINLLLALRNTATGLTVSEVIETVDGYDPAGGASARRMFERDKGVLRELGIAITTHGTGEECRYRVREEDYALPEIRLTGVQAAALDLAASAWRDPELTTSARRALTKVRAVAEDSTTGAVPDLTVDLAEHASAPVLAAAVDERRRVCFEYASAASGTVRSRIVEPYRLRLTEGAWYLEAWDVQAGAERTFRLARIRGEVSVLSEPGAFQAPEMVEAYTATALVALAPGRGLALRAHGLEASNQPDESVPTGWDVLTVPYDDQMSFAGSLAALGSGVLVLEPEPLRNQVIAHLRGAAGLTDGKEA